MQAGSLPGARINREPKRSLNITKTGAYSIVWHIARNAAVVDRVRWAVNTFIPYKALGTDGIYLTYLQKGLDQVIKYLIKVYKRLAMGHILKSWRDVRVVLISKPGREPSLAKSYRLTSLSILYVKNL